MIDRDTTAGWSSTAQASRRLSYLHEMIGKVLFMGVLSCCFEIGGVSFFSIAHGEII